MEITIRDCWDAFRVRLGLWLGLSVAALILALAFQLFSRDWKTIDALVNFSYSGIEAGLDPAGNRFDEQEIKDTELIRAAAVKAELSLLEGEADGELSLPDEEAQAAADAALSLSDANAQAIRNALEIRGVVPSNVFERILNYQSIYGKEAVESMESVRETSYFPSRYQIAFRYADAGLSVKEGTRFLQELLSVYESYFYRRYGYSASLEESVSSIDYDEYEYINAVDILSNRLTSLRAYLATLADKDNTRFVSEKTGYSFSDLLDAVDTIRDEDINWVTSYITSNNVAKNRQELMDYYRYKIKSAERELAERDSRLYALNEQIAGYVKTNAVFLGAASEDGAPAYQFSQPSETYDALINEKIDCETAISETQELIALYEQRIERLESDSAAGNSETVETNLRRIDQKITRFLDDTRRTADDFFKTVWLERAFQIQSAPKKASPSPVRLILGAKLYIAAAEAVLFGLFVLRVPLALRGKRVEKKRKRKLDKEVSAA